MAKTPAVPKVPGEVVEEGITDRDPKAVPADAETVAVPKAQLDALLDRIAALEGAQTTRRANPDADLPDQSHIDSATIKAPMLSKQGWVVPDTFGTNPAAPKG